MGECSSSTKAECIMILSDANFVDLMTGKLDAMQAFMSGKLKVGIRHFPVMLFHFSLFSFFWHQIKGNMMLAQKLGQLKK